MEYISSSILKFRGGSRGGMQGVCTPPPSWDDPRLSKISSGCLFVLFCFFFFFRSFSFEFFVQGPQLPWHSHDTFCTGYWDFTILTSKFHYLCVAK